MPLRIRPDLSIPDASRGAVRELLERARAELARTDDREDGVHEARKALKKVRAIARLLRRPLGAAWRSEDRALRDLGRALSDERDAAAALEALDAVTADVPEDPRFRAVRARLASGPAGAAVVRFPGELDGELSAAAERARGWTIPEKFGPLARGLREGYARARRQGRRAAADPRVATLHAWRRAVKQHAAQVRLFKDTASGPLGAHLALVDQLSDRLGDDHDLEVLRLRLSEEEEGVEELLPRMARRHTLLRRGAFSLGERAFAERPSAFERRVRRYWRASVRDTRGDRAQSAAGSGGLAAAAEG